MEFREKRQGYWIEPELPGSALIKSMVIVHPHGSGRFIGAELNNNGLYDIHLKADMFGKEIVIRNVDYHINVVIPENPFALLSGKASVLLNIDESGNEHPDFFRDNFERRILKHRLEQSEDEKSIYKMMTHEAEHSTLADIRAEERASAIGRIIQKARGRGTMGLRTQREPLPEEMGESMY